MSTQLRPLLALVAVAAAGGALGGYFGLRAAGFGAGSGSTAAPSARMGAAMAYDAARETVVLFGGEGSRGALADTWTWDGSGWTLHHPATSPPARAGALMAYDPASRDLVLVGGANYPNSVAGIACAEPGIALPQPAPVLGPGSTPALSPPTTIAPVPSRPTKPAAPVPPSRCPKPTPQAGVGPLQDTWRWDGGNWHHAGAAPTTVARGLAQLVTEPARSTVLLVTASFVRPELGRACPLVASADTAIACPPIAVQPAYAAYTLGASGWKRVAAPPALAGEGFGLAGAALAVDPVRHRAVLFQGQPQVISICGQVPSVPETLLPQPTAGGAVTGKAGVAPGALPCRLPEGGADLKQAECCTGRVLVWTGAKWEGAGQFRSGPAIAPAAALVGDEATHAIVYVEEQAGVTWAWTGKWTRLHPVRHPDAGGAAVVYDAKRAQVVLFGGTGQTWTWDGTEWTRRAGGSTAAPSPSAEPTAVPLPAAPSVVTSPPAQPQSSGWQPEPYESSS
ncbi:MAG: hypothetical protein E6J45_01185 [Chloroflexi bacterium]|nr:MAG: hypothetical protein E6J45_01185 [Chloroflexota bacterium]